MTEMDADGSIKKWVTITDILGEEDHFGDMDFKVAGTTKGITGFQLDLKINGLPFEIAKTAIIQCRDARIEILKVMLGSLPRPAPASANTPRASRRSRSTPKRSACSSDPVARPSAASPRRPARRSTSPRTTPARSSSTPTTATP
jgi:polyribonucleotide nucleotidyltransferase